MIHKNKKKKFYIVDILNHFSHINRKLNDDYKKIHKVKRQIISGNRVFSNLKNNNKNFNSIKNINSNIDSEIKPINRLNIVNYKLHFNTMENNNINHSNNISEDNNNNNRNQIIKSILDQLVIENRNKSIQNKLRLLELHDCNKRKKIKLKPLNIKPHILNNGLSKSNKSIFSRKILYYNDKKKYDKNDVSKEKEKVDTFLDNQNTSYYSTLFKNTTVNIIKNLNGESEFKNPYYSPVLRRNLWDEFQTIDNGENETYEKSIMIKEGINDLNNKKYKMPLYLSIQRENGDEKKDNIDYDITKIRSIKEIEKVLFKKKKSFLFQNININLKKNNLKSIFLKKQNN